MTRARRDPTDAPSYPIIEEGAVLLWDDETRTTVRSVWIDEDGVTEVGITDRIGGEEEKRLVTASDIHERIDRGELADYCPADHTRRPRI